jgi:hypothetical protein
VRVPRSHALVWLAGVVPAFVAFQIGVGRDDVWIYLLAFACGAGALALGRRLSRSLPRPTVRPDRRTACFVSVSLLALLGLMLGDPAWFFVPEMIVVSALLALALTWAARANRA